MVSHSMRTEVISISPKFAEELLRNNAINRKLRPGVVERYAAQMRDGGWLLTAEPIMLSPEMRLLNGQHRLRAVMLSGKGATFSGLS